MTQNSNTAKTKLSSEQIWAHLDSLTKPPKSLGALEKLAAKLCEIQNSLHPKTQPREMFLFAGDHGVVQEGVSLWPSEVTAAMLQNISQGGAASSVLAKVTQTELHVVDVGSYAEKIEGVEDCKVRAGTKNLFHEPAITLGEFHQAQIVGRMKAVEAAERGAKVVLAGEMGIGNTTASACLAMLLAAIPQHKAVGAGAGATSETANKKNEVVGQAVSRARQMWAQDPLLAIASICGFEIAAIAGFYLAAYEKGLTIILDGYITTVAALIAQFQQPAVSQNMIAAHLSQEPGHSLILEKLQVEPLLDWELRLGEGSGALLLVPMLDAAAAIVSQMATLEELGFGAKI